MKWFFGYFNYFWQSVIWHSDHFPSNCSFCYSFYFILWKTNAFQLLRINSRGRVTIKFLPLPPWLEENIAWTNSIVRYRIFLGQIQKFIRELFLDKFNSLLEIFAWTYLIVRSDFSTAGQSVHLQWLKQTLKLENPYWTHR